MLKVRLNKNDIKENFVELNITYDDLNINEDLSILTGYIDSSCNINEDNSIYITTETTKDYTKLETTTENVLRNGFFIKEEDFNIEEVSENINFGDAYSGDTLLFYVYNYIEGEGYSADTSAPIVFETYAVFNASKRFVRMPNGKIYYENYYLNEDIVSGYEETVRNQVLSDYNSYKNYYNVYRISNGEKIKIYPSKEIEDALQPFFDLGFYGYYIGVDSERTSLNYYIKDSSIINSIPITYYVENNEVTYDGISYSVNENYIVDSDGMKSLILYDFSGNTIADLGYYFEDSAPQRLIKFTSQVPKDYEIKIENISCASKYYYIIYSGKKYDLFFKDGIWQVNILDANNKFKTYYYVLENDKINYYIDDILDFYPTSINIEGTDCPILVEYRNTIEGDYISINTDENYDIQNYNVPIQAEISNYGVISKRILTGFNDTLYIYYNNRKYNLSDNISQKNENYVFTICRYIEVENINNTTCYQSDDKIFEEFEVELLEEYSTESGKIFNATYSDDEGNTTRWIIVNGESGERDNAYKYGSIINYETNTVKAVSSETVTDKYKFNVYRYVSIDGIKYTANISNKIHKETNEEYNINLYSSIETYDLDILSYNNNLMICKPRVDIDYYMLNNDLSNDNNIDNLFNILKKPYKDIAYTILNSEGSIKFKNLFFGSDNHPSIKEYTNKIIDDGFANFFKKVNYISFPTLLKQSNELNLFQEEMVNSSFFEVEKEKAINKIIDMEKDVYYPSILDEHGNFNEVYEIKFNFHLRTRNMEDWTINNLTYSDYSDAESANTKNDNWVIFDDYDKPIESGLTTEELFSSDLLYFLDFSENDIYFQKKKLAKTFLRLLFYDSPDETNQNLLHTSTIFFDASKSYKKYVSNIFEKKYRLYNMLYSSANTYCTVDSEPFIETIVDDDNIFVEIDYSKDRLDCSFSITNRNSATESSEGFYIYMFKEYGYKLRPSTIYMKVELNHAGKGKILHFFMPTENDNLELTNMIDDVNSHELSSLTSAQTASLREGLPLNKVSKYQYIRFNVKYDNNKHKYVYYLPTTYPRNKNYWLDNNTMIFNLWELKFKNEI